MNQEGDPWRSEFIQCVGNTRFSIQGSSFTGRVLEVQCRAANTAEVLQNCNFETEDYWDVGTGWHIDTTHHWLEGLHASTATVQTETNQRPLNSVDELPKYARARRLVDLFQAAEGEGEGEGEGESGPVPLDIIAPQTSLWAWSCLTYDPDVQTNDHLRLNVNQLKSLRDSARGFEEKGVKIVASSLSVHIGVPKDPSTGWTWLSEHLDGHPEAWAGTDSVASLENRRQWQGTIYEMVLNALLTVPDFHGLIFWDPTDELDWMALITPFEDGWPYTPRYPSAGATQSCLFGAEVASFYPENNGVLYQRQMYHPKPAYYGAYNAIANYFGPAFAVKDSDGQELVRFVENGNVLIMKPGATVHPGTENLDQIGPDSARFVVKNAAGDFVAVITTNASLYLAGSVYESVVDLAEPDPPTTAFVIKARNGRVVSLIDDSGNLKLAAYQHESGQDDQLKMGGYLLIDGIPYSLIEAGYEATDIYWQK